jgi:hypothetical protein
VFVAQLVGRLVDRLVDRRQYEVWESPFVGRPCFMVAAALTRRQAVEVADARAGRDPQQLTLVLDAHGQVVYRRCGGPDRLAGPAAVSPRRAGRPAPAPGR